MTDHLQTLNDALYAAFDTGDVAALRMALAAGADMGDWGYKAASNAVLNASVPVLQALGKAGLDWSARLPWLEDNDEPVSVVDGLFSLALFWGVATANVVKFLLAQGADPNRHENGRPLLSGFLLRGASIDVTVLDALLAAAADVNATDALGVTALMCAASRDGNGRMEALARLLAAGADPSMRDHQGKSVADWAAAVPVPAYLDVLRGHGLGGKAPNSQAGIAAPFSFEMMPADGYFVLEPIAKPLCLRWLGRAETVEAALNLVQQRYDWSRPPLGPFPILQRISPDSEGRMVDPFAPRQGGKAALGSLCVLSLSAFSPIARSDQDSLSLEQRPIFVVSGLFPCCGQAAAQSLADAQAGWCCVARLVALTMIADGYLYPAVEMVLD